MAPFHSLVQIAQLRTAAVLLLSLSLPALSLAQVQNGTFSSGGVGWTSAPLPQWKVTFPAAGGNPGAYALITSSSFAGRVFLRQHFPCGGPGEFVKCKVS